MDTDRDLLIQTKTMVEEIHRNMTHPSGRVPQLEQKLDEHVEKDNGRFNAIDTQMSNYAGSWRVIIWILGFIFLGLVTLSGVFAEHLLGGK